MSGERQSANAIRFYEAKSADYDDTWHSDFTRRFISYVDIKEGDDVLDLACGTGLLTFLEAEKVGKTGTVVGIDVTPGMLAVASRKKEQGADKFSNISFHQGDILHLNEKEALKGRTFDVITVASALVLFPDPKAAIEHWSEYLKPGGVLTVDATHPRNLVSGMVLERVARRLELPIPYNRSWSRSESTLKAMLESAGLEVDNVVTVHNQAGYGRRSYDVDQWDDFFVETVIAKDVMRTFATNDIRRKAQGVYKEEWEKLAMDGKVEEVDAVFLGIARKRKSAISLDPMKAYLTFNSCRWVTVLLEGKSGRACLQGRLLLRLSKVHIEQAAIGHNSLPLQSMPALVGFSVSSLRICTERRAQVCRIVDAQDIEAVRRCRTNLLRKLRHSCHHGVHIRGRQYQRHDGLN